VIETFIIDWPVLLFLGLLFGSFAPADGWWRSRAFKAGFIAALVFTIVAFASYAVAPDWMWMYFLDPGDVAWALPGLVVAYVAAYLLGFAAAIGLKPLGTRALVIAAGVTIAAEIGVLALTWSRYHLVGTRSEWLRGEAHELFSISPSGPVKTIGLLVPAFFVVLALAFFSTWRSARAGARPRT
jgi:hypothetical protein